MAACVGGGALSIAIAAVVAFRVEARWVSTLVSYAVGALLGAVFLDILPHLFENNPHPENAAGLLLAGILVFFLLEKVLLWRHHHHHGGEDEGEHGHGAHDHGRSGWMIVFGGNGCLSGHLNDVWVLSDANGIGAPAWTQLTPAGTPPPLTRNHTAVYDPGTNAWSAAGSHSVGAGETG